jgi:hypothetical protein
MVRLGRFPERMQAIRSDRAWDPSREPGCISSENLDTYPQDLIAAGLLARTSRLKAGQLGTQINL